jgi:hypothetical protein
MPDITHVYRIKPGLETQAISTVIKIFSDNDYYVYIQPSPDMATLCSYKHLDSMVFVGLIGCSREGKSHHIIQIGIIHKNESRLHDLFKLIDQLELWDCKEE